MGMGIAPLPIVQAAGSRILEDKCADICIGIIYLPGEKLRESVGKSLI